MNNQLLIIVSASIERSPLSFPAGALSVYTSIIHDAFLMETLSVSHSHYYGDTDDPAAAGEKLASFTPDYLGISLYLFNREWMYAFLSSFSRLSPETVILAGGPDVISSPEELIRRGVSYLSIGEGETTVRMMMYALVQGNKPEGKGIYSQEKPSLLPAYEPDLDALPSPILSLRNTLDSYEGILWEMTRGCPFHCAFCAESRGNRKVRSYSFDRLQAEMEVIREKGIEKVFVLDPTFNLEKKRTEKILTFLIEHSPPYVHYTFEVRGELLDKKTISLFSALTCSLQIGLQSSDPEVMKHVDRAFEPDKFYARVSSLHRHGIVFGLDLIIGLPHDTLESFKNSVEYAVKLRPSNLDIFLLALLPGTELYEQRDTFATSYQSESPYLVIETTTMNEQEIETALAIRKGCDIFYTKGEAVMWFIRVIEALEMSAADFFLSFALFLDSDQMREDDDTFVLQEEFIKRIYTEKGKTEFLPLILSYVELHQGLCYLRDCGEEPVVHLSYPIEILNRLDDEAAQKILMDPGTGQREHDLLLYMVEGEVMIEEV